MIVAQGHFYELKINENATKLIDAKSKLIVALDFKHAVIMHESRNEKLNCLMYSFEKQQLSAYEFIPSKSNCVAWWQTANISHEIPGIGTPVQIWSREWTGSQSMSYARVLRQSTCTQIKIAINDHLYKKKFDTKILFL